MAAFFIGSDASHADWEVLRRAGVSARFLNLRDLIKALRIRFLSPVALDFNGYENELEGARIWYHPGCFDLLESFLIGDDTELHFLSRQYHAVLTYLEVWLGDKCRCIDPPTLQRKWSNKLTQLAVLAEALPDAMIDTCVVSDVALLEEGRVLKRVSENRVVSKSDAFYAEIIQRETLQQLRAGAPLPVISQLLVRAPYEYRTFCFGDERLTVEIPRDEQTSVVDIHFHPDTMAKVRLVESCVSQTFFERIRDALGLSCFAVDYLIVESTPRLLEVNPLFGWEWMPASCHSAVAAAVQRFLHHAWPEISYVG